MSADDDLLLSDCWNTIGVAGDQSCARLEQHIHCRNCEVYAGAARRNLQRPVNDSYRVQWAELLRTPQHERERDDSSALAFRVGREWLAMPSALVDAVAPQAAPHRLPHRASAALLGVVNVGGKLLPAVSLAALLGIDQHDAPRASGRHTFARLLVVRCEGQSYALPAADLHGIVRYPKHSMKAPAATINKGVARFLTGVLTHEDMQIGVLDTDLLGHQMARLLR